MVSPDSMCVWDLAEFGGAGIIPHHSLSSALVAHRTALNVRGMGPVGGVVIFEHVAVRRALTTGGTAVVVSLKQ